MKLKTDDSIQTASLKSLAAHVNIKRGVNGISRVTFKDKSGENDLTDPLIKDAHTQIMAYLNHERTTLDFPIELSGTDFQVAVYEATMRIPYGHVWTYKDIAKAIKRPNAQRAVGGALNKNPLSLIVPCHRVVGTNGKLVGFGSGLPVKKALLKLEDTL
ncbi:MAG: methylated-DNA--[protein]-cysteine S-methyltransferase [Bacillota bacterium]